MFHVVGWIIQQAKVKRVDLKTAVDAIELYYKSTNGKSKVLPVAITATVSNKINTPTSTIKKEAIAVALKNCEGRLQWKDLVQ